MTTKSTKPRAGLWWYIYFILLAFGDLIALTSLLVHTNGPAELNKHRGEIVDFILWPLLYVGIATALFNIASLPYFAKKYRNHILTWTIVSAFVAASVAYLIWAYGLLS